MNTSNIGNSVTTPYKLKQINKQLLTACKNGNIEDIKESITAGANVDARDKTERTALMVAISDYRGNGFIYENKAVTTLVYLGADIYATDDRENTALWWAERCVGNKGLVDRSSSIKQAIEKGKCRLIAQFINESEVAISDLPSDIQRNIRAYLGRVGLSKTQQTQAKKYIAER